MMQNKLFEKYAAAFGYDLTPDYRDYPTALSMVEAMIGGSLDFGMWGNTPIIRVIAAQQPLSLLVVGEGHFRFLVCVRRNSPIRNMQDLKGKVVGALLGGYPFNALSQIRRYEDGSADPRGLGIRVVNTATSVQAASLPAGMDASITTYPALLAAQASGTTAIVNSFGYTEDHYDGAAGKGAGMLLPSVKKTPFYPDGYYLHRSFWVCREQVVEKNPETAVAFVMALQEAVGVLTAMNPGDVSQLVASYWKLPPDQGAKVVRDELLFRRGWVWPTEGDAQAILQTSKYMVEGKQIDAPLSWAHVKQGFSKTAARMQQAYEKMGSKPDATAFTTNQAGDLRGLPVWQIDKWQDRS
jgi:ABC-type nitrate/sulfonate/bicarbonate transport system substrate-binding protein